MTVTHQTVYKHQHNIQKRSEEPPIYRDKICHPAPPNSRNYPSKLSQKDVTPPAAPAQATLLFISSKHVLCLLTNFDQTSKFTGSNAEWPATRSLTHRTLACKQTETPVFRSYSQYDSDVDFLFL